MMYSKLSRRILAGAAALLFLSSSAQAALSGTYTVCANGSCDYITIGAAISDLKTGGVSGPVIIQIGAGTYNEAFTIGSITGASATNTILIRGNGSSGSNRTIINGTPVQASTRTQNAAVVNLLDAEYVSLKEVRVINPTNTDYAAAVLMYGCTNSAVDFGVIAEGSRITTDPAFPFKHNVGLLVRRNTNCTVNSVNTNYGVSNTARIDTNTNLTVKFCSFNAIGWAGLGDNYNGVYSRANNGITFTSITSKGGQGKLGTALASLNDRGFTLSQSQLVQSNGSQALNINAELYNGAVYEIYNNYIVYTAPTTVSGVAVYINEGYYGATTSGNSEGVDMNFYHNTLWSNALGDGLAPGLLMQYVVSSSVSNRTSFANIGNNLFFSQGKQKGTYQNGNFLAKYPDYTNFDFMGYNVYRNAGGSHLKVGGVIITLNSGNVNGQNHLTSLDTLYGSTDYNVALSFDLSKPNSRRLSAQGPRSPKSYGLNNDNESHKRCVATPTIGADEFTNTYTCPASIAATGTPLETGWDVTLLGNPTAEAFRFISSEDAVATLWTLTGAQVGSINAQAGYVNTLGEGMPAGQYILRVATQTGVKNLSVVKL